jgi:UDP-glucose 6-dehydrogenase
MLGADVSKVQETLNKAQAQQLAIIAATYSAEQILTKVTVVAGSESKAQAIKEVVAQVVVSMPEFMEAVTAVKTTVKDTVNIVTDTKKKVEEVKASTETKTDTTVKK